MGIALLLALLVDNISKGQQFFRTVYFFPIVISATALGLMFNLVFLYDTGMLNQLRLSLGASELVDFKDEAHALFTLMVPVVWQYAKVLFRDYRDRPEQYLGRPVTRLPPLTGPPAFSGMASPCRFCTTCCAPALPWRSPAR